MKRARPHYHHGDLRNALLEQAVKLVEEAGAEGFSLREAARLVGVTANAAYRHFSDKSQLLAAVAGVGFRLQERRIRKALGAVADRPTKAGTAVERLKAAGRAYVEFAVDHPGLLRVMFAAGAPGRDGAERPPAVPYLLLGQVLDDLAAAGVLSADRRRGAELKAWAVVHGFAWLVVQGVPAVQARSRRAQALESMLDFAIVGLCGRLD
jgi:AcrR family transcriptional regulator